MSEQKNVAKDSMPMAIACHIAIAVLFCIALAIEISAWASGAKNEVIGAAFFLVVVWLGLPVGILVILAIYHSSKALDQRIMILVPAMFVPIALMVVGAPLLISILFQAFYVILVLIVGLIW